MVVSVVVIVLSSPGSLTTLVIVDTEPGSVFVAYSVKVKLPPGAVNVAPGSVLVSYSVKVAPKPEIVEVIVGPGSTLVTTDV